MPELPEVETLRRGLERRLTGRVVTRVRVPVPKMLKGRVVDPEAFAAALGGRRIESVGRRGKHLIFRLDCGYYLLLHLKMRGQLLVVPRDLEEGKYLAVALEMEDGSELRFHDMWTWGELRLMTEAELAAHPSLKAMGLEPFSDEWTPQALQRSLSRRARTSVKAALLDQTVVAGVGNIYADESLFRAGIGPLRPAGSLTDVEASRLHREIRCVLAEATGDGGTTSDNYVDADGRTGRYAPRVYERAGQPCVRCGTPLTRIKVTGRGTVYCPSCQS
ncbi:MAG: bifunctional DNA-formamidopyrimidine glycosylase/DNA-(apurinic or apyrimidinic site) lyase [Armatimonadetes bacterium]|nr:bifunctional DNA-formamidopyrimidine glycosylase/DNA-(apurinic or apyrimidinic site) lyase [Armatimonadota bacterium]